MSSPWDETIQSGSEIRLFSVDDLDSAHDLILDSQVTPTRLGDHFEVLGELGEGAMGWVLRARQVGADREVAIKIVHQDKLTEVARKRFAREGVISARLDHPAIVRVHTCGEVAGLPFLAYELVEDCVTLEESWDDLDLRRRIEILRDAARGLGHAHAQGVIHRDVKPANILLDGDGRVRVADFGLSTAVGVERLTRDGAFLGTPHYMPPEQFKSEREEQGPWSDVWSLGVILYQALTETLPFDAPRLAGLGTQILTADPEPPRRINPQAPSDLERVCLMALRYDPKKRYPEGGAFAEDLDRWLTEQPVQAPRAPRYTRGQRQRGIAYVALGLAVLALLLVWTAPPPVSPDPGPSTPPKYKGRPPLKVKLLDPGHAPGPQVAERERPEWFDRLAAKRKPQLPLPQGVTFGHAQSTYMNVKDGSLLVWVPPTTFRMGSDSLDADKEERPAHEVTLEGYFVGRHEVTWGQYRFFCQETGRKIPFRKIKDPLPWQATDQHPVYYVTWDDAVAYCEWAGLRLPTEAEWELAARGTDGRVYPWGNHLPAHQDQPACNLADARYGEAAPDLAYEKDYDDGYDMPSPVGSFPLGSSPYGCLDMAGNVWEWVADWHGDYPTRPQTNPRNDNDRTGERVTRGGSWCYPARDCRTFSRSSSRPTVRRDFIGFRVARSS